jgi:hypothetical protein
MTTVTYVRGAFIAYEPLGYPDKKRVIPFRFNPESLSRTLSVEAGESGGGVEGAAPRSAPPPASEASADASSGALKESFSVVIRLDFADREESLSGLDPKLGIAPEIAAIEELLYPAATQAQAASDGSEPVRKAADRPTVLFVWGQKRVLPVRIASLKIDESFYNSELNPIRAEIEASLEVLGEAEAQHNAAVRPALDYTHKARQELAKLFYAKASTQNTRIPELKK